MEDFTRLASSGLPSLGGSSDGPTWNRSLFELKAASDSLWSYNSQNANSTAEAAKHSSLSVSHRLPDLSRMTRTLESGTSQAPGAESEFLQWQETNRRREVDILKRIVSKAEESTREKSQQLVEKQLQEEWERTRDLWAKELVGTRTLGGSATESTIPGHAMLDNSVSHAPSLLLALDQHTHDPASRHIDPQIVRFHVEITRRLQESGQRDFLVCAEAANEIAKSVNYPGQDSPQNRCYETALQLVSRILSRQNLSPVETALATLIHFSNQFETWIISNVRKVTLAGQDRSQGASQVSNTRYKSANANTIATFVSLELGATIGTSFWPSLYYALRIGDAVSAKEIFEANSAGTESDDTRSAIINVLSALVQRQGASATIWEAQGPLVVPSDSMRSVSEACERAKTSERPDIHRVGFLSLLSGANDLPLSEAVAGLSTIEDYLFGLLWLALLQSEPVNQLEKVGKQILGYGAGYFSDQDSGGWSYSLPLIAVQQYRTALSYLVEAGGATGLMQATHLGMLLSSCGATLDNLGDSKPLPKSNLVTKLLVDYATWLHADPYSGAECALVYFACVPTKPLLTKEIVKLILQANDISSLVGDLSDAGTRLEGALDAYFSKTEISSFLKQAAQTLAKDTKNREKARKSGILFMLAGDFRSVILLLSRLLSPNSVLQNEDKRYWYQQAREFFATYLHNGRTHVLESLEKNDDLDAVTTCRALMEVFDFFEFMSRGEANKAWYILDNNLDILPKSQSEISAKEMRYRTLDPLLQKSLPSVLMAAMQSLNHEHRLLKHSGAQGPAQNRLLQLKERGTALITFAGMIPDVDPDKIEAMSRLETSMI